MSDQDKKYVVMVQGLKGWHCGPYTWKQAVQAKDTLNHRRHIVVEFEDVDKVRDQGQERKRMEPEH